MKKILSLLLAITLVFSLSACGQSSGDGTGEPTETETTERNVEVGDRKGSGSLFLLGRQCGPGR